jgi:hypothetical protein
LRHELPSRVHEALIKRTLKDRLVGHISRDATAIEAREKPVRVGKRLERDLAALQTPLPAPYDACEKVPASVSSLSLVRYRRNDFSAMTW